jgi:hypothetical protein
MSTRRLSRLILAGIVAAFVAVPVAHASNRQVVQIDGRLVPPAQVSEAQLAAGHDPSTRLVQIGGRLIAPSQLSAWQNRDTVAASPRVAAEGSSSDFSTGALTATAVFCALIVLAASALIVRRRRGLAPA